MKNLKRLNFAVLLLGFLFGFNGLKSQQIGNKNQLNLKEENKVQILVDTDSIIAKNINNKLGINLNAGIDNDVNRNPNARPISHALKKLGAKHLRFPGGKKSLYYVWSEPPHDNPSTARWVAKSYYNDASVNTINFDEFMALCNEVGAQAHINVAYNPSEGLDEHLAAQWVKYANVTNNYDIKYWEIGNEMWQEELGFTTESLAEVVKTYSKAMKAIDSTIKIGVSWKDQDDIIKATEGDLDFIAISNYLPQEQVIKSYQDYALGNNVNLSSVNSNLKLNTVVSEYNSISWIDDPWDKINVAGKGLMNFDLLGQLLSNNNCIYACYWNTRWFTDKGSIFDALNDDNEILPAALPLTLWAKFIEPNLVDITSNDQVIVPYATNDSIEGNLVLFLINKGSVLKLADIDISSEFKYNKNAQLWQYKALNENDMNPVLQKSGEVQIQNNKITELELPKISITVIVVN